MARQLRIEFEGAYYHILSRGNNRSNIFHSDEDRQGTDLGSNLDYYNKSDN